MNAPWLEDSKQRFQQLMQATNAPVLLYGHQIKGLYNLVMEFLASTLCEAQKLTASDAPCGHCPACHMRLAGNHPDLRHLMPQAKALALGFPVELKTGTKPSQDIRIDDVRDLQNYFTTASSRGAARFVVVYPFDDMNTNTANALLKTLEEPPTGLRFILIGHRADQLLPTIRSRCQQMHLPMPTHEESIQWLDNQGVKQSDVVLSLAMNDPFEALNLSQQAPDQLELRKKWIDWLAQTDPQPNPPIGTEKMGLPVLFDLVMRLCADCVQVSQGLQPSSFSWLTPKLLWTRNVAWIKFSRVYATLQAESRIANHPINPRLVLEFIAQQWQTVYV